MLSDSEMNLTGGCEAAPPSMSIFQSRQAFAHLRCLDILDFLDRVLNVWGLNKQSLAYFPQRGRILETHTFSFFCQFRHNRDYPEEGDVPVIQINKLSDVSICSVLDQGHPR